MQTDATTAGMQGHATPRRVSTAQPPCWPRRDDLRVVGKWPNGYRDIAKWIGGALGSVSPQPRRDCVVHLSFEEMRFTVYSAPNADPVLAGIVRRLRAKLESTCAVYGNAGRRRPAPLRGVTLCARCFAPHLLGAMLPREDMPYGELVEPDFVELRSTDLPKIWRREFKAEFGGGAQGASMRSMSRRGSAGSHD